MSTNNQRTLAGIPLEDADNMTQPTKRIMEPDTIIIDKDLYYSIIDDLDNALHDNNNELLNYIQTQDTTAEVNTGEIYTEGSNFVNVSLVRCAPDASHHHIVLWIPGDDTKHMELGIIDANGRIKCYDLDEYPTSVEDVKRRIDAMSSAETTTDRNYEPSPQPEHRLPTTTEIERERDYHIQQIAEGKIEAPTLESMLQRLEENKGLKLMMMLTSLKTGKSVEQLIQDELDDVAQRIAAIKSTASTIPGPDTIQ